MTRLLSAVLVLGLLLAVSCSPNPKASATNPAATYLATFIDSTADPRANFFQYSVGKWLRENPIPANERGWGIASVVQEETYHRLVSISEASAANASAAKGSNAQKIGDFWFAAMDSAKADQQGYSPLAAEFARIASIQSRDSLLAVSSHLQYLGAGPMFSVGIYQDEKHSDRDVLHLYQGGLGLPSRDYYVDSDDRSRMIRKEYVAHVARMFELLGDDSLHARAGAAAVMTLETQLAKASRKLADLRDPQANYHAMAVADLGTLTPSVRWKEFLEQQRVTGIDSVVVGQPEFFKQLESSLRTQSLADWKTYLRWSLANTFAAQAGGAFDTEDFHSYSTILNGTSEQRPRWKRMLDQEEGYLGDALGQLYVQQYFSPRTKARYEKLTNDIFDAFRERIRHLEWMSEPTRERALVKLDAVTKKVGYPERWRDYSTFAVDRESFLGNCLRGNIWRSEYYIAKLHKPVDRTEWDMTPQTYNAYYNPSNNEIVLPAAIFILPGIADSLVDDAVVYGYAGGTTIGHEITHGFDDQGRQFDEHGNLVGWWTPQDEKEFKRRAAGIISQFDQYIAVGDLHVNGSATQGENIADLGGITLGWDAFKKTAQYQKGDSLGGLSPSQRYFMGWALGWMNQRRPESMALRVKTDVHSPSFLRVIGPVSNMTPFYEAYGVKAGDKMYRGDSVRVQIW